MTPAPTREADRDADDEITVERRVRHPAVARDALRATTRLTRIDSRLLAIARGDLEPENDPFGGLIPVYDDVVLDEVDEEWLTLDPDAGHPIAGVDPEPSSVELSSVESVLGQVVPRLRIGPAELMVCPVGRRCALFASQIDGRRTIGELMISCGFDDLEALETVDELLRVGAITLT